MTAARSHPPVTASAALASYPRAALRPLFFRTRWPRATAHDRALLDYQLALPRILRRRPVRFVVREVRVVSAHGEGGIRELTLEAEARAVPGDMLYLGWRNAPDAVAAVLPAGAADAVLPYWTTPAPGVPSRRARATSAELAATVLDLADALAAQFPELPRAAPRMVPRVFTLSGVRSLGGGRQELRVLVSHHAAWPSRAAAHLHRVVPGEALAGWVLPHPHRLPPLHGALGDGVAVVTGSGIAGVLAALRSGVAGRPWLVWGLRGEPAPWLRAELDGYAAAGAIRRLDVVDSRAASGLRRVTDVLASASDAVAADLASGAWLYVSGHAAMADPVRAAVTAAAGPDTVERLQATLRYVEST
ncbi:ferredoxin reductase domain-containing protein [Protaetiibacter intestinalis]|uniref:FAD-binding FR-type domain-containing protein n=1 Tax=Protaetiibacter intestinalis TaxID=2419774 RepID=A0A387B3P1_9MICO|nr:hypothetical protein [Protaetiibacter intestinalis]AYF96927.1 hypothetical protein D7I47_00760 [Protaetiibacter intestinalis]